MRKIDFLLAVTLVRMDDIENATRCLFLIHPSLVKVQKAEGFDGPLTLPGGSSLKFNSGKLYVNSKAIDDTKLAPIMNDLVLLIDESTSAAKAKSLVANRGDRNMAVPFCHHVASKPFLEAYARYARATIGQRLKPKTRR
jgi:hypothetical protein